jgi:hypothetical protein
MDIHLCIKGAGVLYVGENDFIKNAGVIFMNWPVSESEMALNATRISAPADLPDDDDNAVVNDIAQTWQNTPLTDSTNNDNESEPSFFRGLEDFTKNGTEWVARAAEKLGLKGVANGVRGASRGALRVEHAVGGSAQVAVNIAGHAVNITGDYLTDLARHESGNNPLAHAPTSSAAGLDQFVEQTWLGTVSKHGAQYGGELAMAASHIHFNGK